jgi:Mrp family chromosome partitioning ATPase
MNDEQLAIAQNLANVKKKLIVMSGKGGVGKSTVAVNLAISLANKGFKTGLLDIDIHGPSVPKLLGVGSIDIQGDKAGNIAPYLYNDFLKVMSIGFLLQNSEDALIWRGPRKHGVIKQFLKDVAWGALDYLVVDSPPGTGDESLAISQLLENDKYAVIVTTPQDVALLDVSKSITFCNQLSMPIVGVIENMSGFTCPHCNNKIDIFKQGGGEHISQRMGVPFLGALPLDSSIPLTGDEGQPFMKPSPDEPTAVCNLFDELVSKILNFGG